jgi:hypothetical protein
MAQRAPRHPNYSFGGLAPAEIAQSKQRPRRTKGIAKKKATRSDAAQPANFNP